MSGAMEARELFVLPSDDRPREFLVERGRSLCETIHSQTLSVQQSVGGLVESSFHNQSHEIVESHRKFLGDDDSSSGESSFCGSDTAIRLKGPTRRDGSQASLHSEEEPVGDEKADDLPTIKRRDDPPIRSFSIDADQLRGLTSRLTLSESLHNDRHHNKSTRGRDHSGDLSRTVHEMPYSSQMEGGTSHHTSQSRRSTENRRRGVARAKSSEAFLPSRPPSSMDVPRGGARSRDVDLSRDRRRTSHLSPTRDESRRTSDSSRSKEEDRRHGHRLSTSSHDKLPGAAPPERRRGVGRSKSSDGILMSTERRAGTRPSSSGDKKTDSPQGGRRKVGRSKSSDQILAPERRKLSRSKSTCSSDENRLSPKRGGQRRRSTDGSEKPVQPPIQPHSVSKDTVDTYMSMIDKSDRVRKKKLDHVQYIRKRGPGGMMYSEKVVYG